jgi:hypothetical protein
VRSVDYSWGALGRSAAASGSVGRSVGRSRQRWRGLRAVLVLVATCGFLLAGYLLLAGVVTAVDPTVESAKGDRVGILLLMAVVAAMPLLLAMGALRLSRAVRRRGGA